MSPKNPSQTAQLAACRSALEQERQARIQAEGTRVQAEAYVRAILKWRDQLEPLIREAKSEKLSAAFDAGVRIVIPGRVEATAWICTSASGKVLHFSELDGWTLDIVMKKPS